MKLVYGVNFFIISFCNNALNDLQRGDFYSTIGLDAKQFDIHVIRKTNHSGYLFIILDLDNPKFLVCLENCVEANQV